MPRGPRGVATSRVVGMLISDSRRVLFVHVQKTGGHTTDTLLTEALPDRRSIPGLQRHPTLGEILDAEPALADYFVFGFVRNPWARMVSWWSMVQRFKSGAENGREHVAKQLARNPFLTAVADYPDFATYLERGPVEHERLRRPQWDYLHTGPEHDGRAADFIGRTESLDADLRTVFEKVGLATPAEVPQMNRSRPGDYHSYYDDATRDRVAELFAADIEAFGYTF